tara:strand:+ start:142 stop:414 length:273 start_codon:yes stop_codon:yes gene_type:complete
MKLTIDKSLTSKVATIKRKAIAKISRVKVTNLMDEEEINYHLANKKDDTYYPRLPLDLGNRHTMMGFVKRLDNYLAKKAYNAQHTKTLVY